VTWQREDLNNAIEGCTKFPKSRRHLKIPDASYVTWRQFHTEEPTISRHCCTKYSPPRLPATNDLCTPAAVESYFPAKQYAPYASST